MEFVNYYTHIKQNNIELYHYPNEDKMNITLPCRMLFVGGTGSGKTSLLFNFIKMIGIFDKIILCCKDKNEPLYLHFIEVYTKIEKKLGIKVLLAIDSIKDMPTPEDCDPKENTLFICDDLICEGSKDLDKVGQFWIRARKRSVSMVFLSQSYYKIPQLIRQNSNYIIMKKLQSIKDLKRILSEYSLGVDIDMMTKMYSYAMEQGDPHSAFFMIDTVTPKQSLRFRAKLEPIMTDSD